MKTTKHVLAILLATCMALGVFAILASAGATWTATVTGGAGGGDYAQGETVTITAYPPEGGIYRFVRWDVYPEATFTEGTSAASPTAKFIMPASEVAAVAVYEYVPPKWWESPPLPYWLHCLLKYLCFGWLWMK